MYNVSRISVRHLKVVMEEGGFSHKFATVRLHEQNLIVRKFASARLRRSHVREAWGRDGVLP